METEAFKQESAKASKGDVKAMNNVAEAYFRGKDVPKDLAKSFEWFKKAADKGNAYGLYRLGLAYQKGWGCAANDKLAVEALKRSLDKGGTGACKTLASIYGDKASPLFNKDEMVKYAEMGVSNGCDTSMYLLALHCFDIRDDRAMSLLHHAASKGNAKAMVEMGDCYSFGRGVGKSDAEAVDWYQKAADAGDATGLYRVGKARYSGKGRPIDLKAAAECLEKARAAGEMLACETLYYIYTKDGPLLDEAKAVETLKYGWQQGSMECERMLAEHYRRAGDIAKAVPMLERCTAPGATDFTGGAAMGSLARHYLSPEGNDPARAFGYLSQIMKKFGDFPLKTFDEAPVLYALCLFTGHGTAKDPKAAMAALKMAEGLGSAPAQEVLKTKRFKGYKAAQMKKMFGLQEELRGDVKYLLQMKKVLPDDFKDEPIPEVPISEMEIDLAPYLDPVADVAAAPKPEAEKVALLRQRAKEGNVEAMFTFGKALLTGDGMPRDAAEGIRWLQAAGDKDHLPAQVLLVDYYRGEHGVAPSHSNVVHWAAKAALAGDARCQHLMGAYCYLGKGGVGLSQSNAFNWFWKAAGSGHAGGMTGVGLCYYAGMGVTRNPTEAVKWFYKAAQLGDADAQYHMGECLSKGDGINANSSLARQWYAKAAAQGHAKARSRL